MSEAIRTLDGGRATSVPAWLGHVWEGSWKQGLFAAFTWAATALVTVALPDVVPWGSAGLFAKITGGGAIVFVALALLFPLLGRSGARLAHYGPWFIAIGVWLALWELTTAKFGWLPKPFFSPPHGLLNVYVTDGPRLLICIGYTLRLWGLGFLGGISVGYVLGVALGWSNTFEYYKLWEGSWADDAVKDDAERNVFVDPSRVRKVKHQGEHLRLDALHLSEPSPQRTPVLYQAGTSPAGRNFAARHAECVFMSGPSTVVIAPRVAAIRANAVKLGRDPRGIVIFTMATAILAETDEEAREKYEDYKRYADFEGALTLLSGWTGVDFSKLDPDQVVEHVENEAGRTALENITRADPSRRWTVRQAAEHVCIGGIGPVFVGSPATVADQMERWIEATDIDGFNLCYAVRPETFVDVADLLVPELQRRGRYKKAYREGALRQKLFGGSARLQAPHVGASHRWS